MKKYAVFTKTEFVPTHELSLSNKIIEKEDVLTVLDIIRNWVHSIDPNVLVYYKGNIPDVNMFTAMNPIAIGDNMGFVVIHKESNVRFRLGFFKKTYETHEVK